MQVIEVHHMVLGVLRAEHQVANQLGVLGHADAKGVLHGAYTRERVDCGANTAGALGEGPGVAWIAAFQYFFEAAHHGPRTVCIGDRTVLDDSFDAKVSLNAGYRVNHHPCHVITSRSCSVTHYGQPE